jgi:hypothetical protein
MQNTYGLHGCEHRTLEPRKFSLPSSGRRGNTLCQRFLPKARALVRQRDPWITGRITKSLPSTPMLHRIPHPLPLQISQKNCAVSRDAAYQKALQTSVDNQHRLEAAASHSSGGTHHHLTLGTAGAGDTRLDAVPLIQTWLFRVISGHQRCVLRDRDGRDFARGRNLLVRYATPAEVADIPRTWAPALAWPGPARPAEHQCSQHYQLLLFIMNACCSLRCGNWVAAKLHTTAYYCRSRCRPLPLH